MFPAALYIFFLRRDGITLEITGEYEIEREKISQKRSGLRLRKLRA